MSDSNRAETSWEPSILEVKDEDICDSGSILDKKLPERICQKEIPIFPLRYGVKSKDSKDEIKYSEIKYPELTSLSYCMRFLRSDGYVYLYDETDDSFRIWKVNNEGTFTELLAGVGKPIDEIPDNLYREEDIFYSKGLETPYVIASSTSTKTYIGFSDVLWTKRIFESIRNPYSEYGVRKSLMTKIDVKGWKEGSSKKTTFVIEDIKKLSEEYKDENWNQTFAWSDFLTHRPNASADNLANTLRHILKGNGKVIGVKLYDNIGLVREQTAFLGKTRENLENFMKESGHKKVISDAIEILYKMDVTDNIHDCKSANDVEMRIQNERNEFNRIKLKLEKNQGYTTNERLFLNHYPNTYKNDTIETFRSEFFKRYASKYTGRINEEKEILEENEDETSIYRIPFLKEYNKKYKKLALALIKIKNDRYLHLKNFWGQGGKAELFKASFQNYDLENPLSAYLYAQTFTECIEGMMSDPAVVVNIKNLEHKLFEDWWTSDSNPIMDALKYNHDYTYFCYIDKESVLKILEILKKLEKKIKEETDSTSEEALLSWAYHNKTDVIGDIIGAFGEFQKTALINGRDILKRDTYSEIRKAKKEIESLIHKASNLKVDKKKAQELLNHTLKAHHIPALLVKDITVYEVNNRANLLKNRSKNKFEKLLKLLETEKLSGHVKRVKITGLEYVRLFSSMVGISDSEKIAFKMKKSLKNTEMLVYLYDDKSRIKKYTDAYNNAYDESKKTKRQYNRELEKHLPQAKEYEKEVKKLENQNNRQIEKIKDSKQSLDELKRNVLHGNNPWVATIDKVANPIGVITHLINLNNAYVSLSEEVNLVNNVTYAVAFLGTTASILDTLEAFSKKPIGTKTTVSDIFLKKLVTRFGYTAAFIDGFPDAVKAFNSHVDKNFEARNAYATASVLWTTGGVMLRMSFLNPMAFIAVVIILGLATFFSQKGNYLSYNSISRWLNACAFGNHEPHISKAYDSENHEKEYGDFLTIVHEPKEFKIDWSYAHVSEFLTDNIKTGRILELTVELPVWKGLKTIEWGIKFTDNPNDYAFAKKTLEGKEHKQEQNAKIGVFKEKSHLSELEKRLSKYDFYPEILMPFYNYEKNTLSIKVITIPPAHVFANFMIGWYENFNDNKIKIIHHYQIAYGMTEATIEKITTTR